MNTTKTSKAAAALGSIKTPAKAAAARANGAKGGRPARLLVGRRLPGLPIGDETMELTQPATDTDGRTWEIGSIYVPQSGGVDGGYRYQDAMIRRPDGDFVHATFSGR